MRKTRAWLRRFRETFHGKRADRELSAELETHLALHIEDNLRSGMAPEEARRQALIKLGGIEQAKELCRERRGIPLVDSLWQDLRYGARMLRKTPGFTAVALLTLALGIGANTAIFSLLNTLFLQPLPVPDSSRLVDVYRTIRGRGYRQMSLSDYLYYRDQARTLVDLAAQYPTAPIDLVISGHEPRQVNGSVVTFNYFRLLGVAPALGRLFTAQEDKVPGRDPVAVISYGLWREWFGGDPHAIGESVVLNGAPFTVIGVTQRGFQGAAPGKQASDIWIPSAMFHVGYRYCDAFRRGCRVVTLLGRLKPGRTVADAQAELSVLVRQLASAYPATNEGDGVAAVPARGIDPDRQEESTRSAATLAGMVALVLLIACANVAGLLLLRGVARRKEITVRLALGAGRRRIIRQLLTESLILSTIGGAMGLLVAFWAQHLLLLRFYATTSEGGRQYFALNLSPMVLWFTLAISFATGIIFGLAPAFRSSRADLIGVLKDEGSCSGARRSILRSALVVAQIAVSLMLVVASSLLVRSLANVNRGAGYDPSHLLWLRLRPSLVGYDTTKAWNYQREVLRRTRAMPGVISASPSDFSPLRQADSAFVWLPDHPPARPQFGYPVEMNIVGPRYFETLGVPVLQGREFTEQDRKGQPLVAMINQALMRHFWPNRNPIGETLVADDGQSYRVVGVVQNAQYYATGQQPPPFFYTDYWQQDTSDSFAEDSRMLVRVAGDPRAMLAQIRGEAVAVDPIVPISEDRPLVDWLEEEFSQVQIAETFTVCFGLLALFLAAIGLHAILGFAVDERTREIGIHLALGATTSDVARLVARQGIQLALIGGCIGMVASLASARFLGSLLYGVRPYDTFTFLSAPLVLTAMVGLACYFPVRRASRVDPTTALRHE